MRIDPHTAPARRVVEIDPPGRGLEIARRILRVDPALDGVGTGQRPGDVRRQSVARRDVNLFLHQIAAVNLLGDGVLHLDAGIHLDEVIVAFLIDQELHRARIHVTDRLRELDRGLPHSLAQPGREERRRTFFDHLLVAPLDRTIAFPEVHGVAIIVGHDLKLDVVRVHDQLLDINVGVAERFLRFHPRAVKSLHETHFVMRRAHPATAAAGRPP